MDQIGPELNELSCPGKTFAIFAHMEDFNYAKDKQPELVKIVNKCETLEQIRALQKLNKLPQSEVPDYALQPSVAKIELFCSQRLQPIKLVAWV